MPVFLGRSRSGTGRPVYPGQYDLQATEPCKLKKEGTITSCKL